MKRNYFLFFLLSIFTLVLSSCATVTQPPTGMEEKLTWSQREAQLTAITNWTLSGALGIQQPGQSQFASLTWQQQGSNYQQTISGPMGIGAVRIFGSPGHVTYWKSAQEQFTADSPESLMQEKLGWQLPISNLYYWVRGLPVPGIAGNKNFDATHHLIALQQDGWQVNYLAYSDVNGVDLPSQIKLINQTLQMQVKLVIKQWEL